MLSESAIITGLKSGTNEAVEAMLNNYGDRMLRTALAITGDLHTAEEVVQDALLQVCRKIHTFQGHSSLQTWVLSIAVNLAKNKLRGGWFRRVVTLDDRDLDQLTGGNASSPEEQILKRESAAKVLRCLQQLPVKYREVLVLYYLEELSVQEISRVLGQPGGTVKSKLARGRALMRAKMKTKWGMTGGTL